MKGGAADDEAMQGVSEDKADSPRIEDALDEQSICNSIPISKFKSNTLTKKRQGKGITIEAEEAKLDMYGAMSPTAGHAVRDLSFKNAD